MINSSEKEIHQKNSGKTTIMKAIMKHITKPSEIFASSQKKEMAMDKSLE